MACGLTWPRGSGRRLDGRLAIDEAPIDSRDAMVGLERDAYDGTLSDLRSQQRTD